MSGLKDLKCLRLDIRYCGGETSIPLSMKNVYMGKLKELSMWSAGDFGYEEAEVLSNQLPKLEMLLLNAYRINSDFLTVISRKMTYLRHLNLEGQKLTNEALLALGPDLRHLDTIILNRNPGIGSVGIEHFVKNFSGLTKLCLSGCHRVMDDGVTLIAEGLRQLEHLDLTACQFVSDKGALMVARKLSHLTFLSFSKTNVSDEGFISVSQNLLKLQNLRAKLCPITENAFIQATLFLQNLEHLSFGSDLITVEGIAQAVVHLKGLTSMTLAGCSKATIGDLRSLIQMSLPHIFCLKIEYCEKETEMSYF